MSSSMGWSPGSKKRELFHTLSRLILAYDESSQLVGFAMFRFDIEDDEEVLYWFVWDWYLAYNRSKMLVVAMKSSLPKMQEE